VSISPNQEQYLGWRGIEQVLSDAVTGVHSQLEYRFDRDVAIVGGTTRTPWTGG
jgi:hypothetical protein